MKKTIRIGVVGCASIAERMVIPALKSLPEFELTAVASRTAEKAQKFAELAGCEAVVGYEQLLERPDIDAIYMPLPTGMHLQYGSLALRNGKHLLLEKSLAMNLEEAKTLTGLAREHKLVLKENYMFEYHSQQEIVRQLIRERLGEIRNFRASFGFPPLKADNFRYDKDLGGGAVLDAGGYVLKSIKVFFPGSKSEVKSSILRYNNQGVDLWGSAQAEVTWENQTFGAQLAFGFDNFYQCGIEVWGNRGKLTTQRTFTAGPGVTPTGTFESAAGKEELTWPQDNHFANLLQAFANAIAQGKYEPEYTAIQQQATLQQQLW